MKINLDFHRVFCPIPVCSMCVFGFWLRNQLFSHACFWFLVAKPTFSMCVFWLLVEKPYFSMCFLGFGLKN